MRYVINFDKTINQLVPHYIGGRKLILYLQAIMKPLQTVNDQFVGYAKETRIEASMTSQKIKFEWYLNRKFSKYFLHGGKITIKNGEKLGVPIYRENADIQQKEHMLLYTEGEQQKQTSLHYHDEKTEGSSYSFIVSSPAINPSLITQEQYIAMLSYYIDKYRLSGKSYIIKFNI